MPNRHAPHSHIAGEPKSHKPCAHCGNHIMLQPERMTHVCSMECAVQQHDYVHEPHTPLTRYFTEAWEEICGDCMDKSLRRAIREEAERVSTSDPTVGG